MRSRKTTRRTTKRTPRRTPKKTLDGANDNKDFKVGIMKELLQQILYSVDGKLNKCLEFITNESSGFFGSETTSVFKKFLHSEYKNKTASIHFMFDSFNRTASRRGAVVSEKPLVYENTIAETPGVYKVKISDEDILSNCYEESKTEDKISQQVLKMIELTMEKFQIVNHLVSISSDKKASVCELKGQASVNVLNILLVLKKNGYLSDLYVEKLSTIITELDALSV